VALPVASITALSEMQASLRQSTQQVVRDQLAEQRRFVLTTFEAFARRMSAEIKDGIAKIPAPPVIETLPEAPRPQWWPAVLTGLLAVIPAAVLGFLNWQMQQDGARLNQELVEARTATAAAEREAAAAALAAAAAATAAAAPDPDQPFATEYVPYGETPLARRRLERLQGIVESLEAQDFKGRIVVESFIGDFCLSGSAAEGFSLADSLLPSQQCDLVGNPFQDALLPAQNQSVEFANFIAIMRQRFGGAITIEVANAGRSRPVAYPTQGERSTAGDWNAVAAQNNRVEFRVEPGL
jgi:hypothetical protein